MLRYFNIYPQAESLYIIKSQYLIKLMRKILKLSPEYRLQWTILGPVGLFEQAVIESKWISMIEKIIRYETTKIERSDLE